MLYTTCFWRNVVVDCCTLVILEDSRKNGGWIVKPDYSISGIFGVDILVCMYLNLSLLLINKISFCMMGGITCSLCNIIILCLVFLFTTFIFCVCLEEEKQPIVWKENKFPYLSCFHIFVSYLLIVLDVV